MAGVVMCLDIGSSKICSVIASIADRRIVEILGIGPEADGGAGVALAHRAGFGEGFDEIAVGKVG
mgnify:CR=1 FL=1